MFFLMTLSLFISALTEELDAIQLVANNTARALNTWGDLVVNHLQDIPMHTGEITLHNVRHRAMVALMTA